MKRLLASTAVIGLAVAGMGTSSAAPSENKVTGGGQYFDIGEEPTGAGNTIAFQAQGVGDGSPARGQIQYVGRSGENAGDKFHASDITCFLVVGNMATIVGTDRAGQEFRLDLVDNGEGSTGSADMILVDRNLTSDNPLTPGNEDESDCNTRQDDQLPVHARGNVQVHKAKG